MSWAAILILISVVRIRLYKIKTREFLGLSVGYWALLYFGLCISEALRRILTYIDLEWWVGVCVLFSGFLIGELWNLFMQRETKNIQRNNQTLPSFFVFSACLVMVAWIFQSSETPFEITHLGILLVSFFSVFLDVILISISDRLLFSDVPEKWQGTPSLLAASTILLVILLDLLKNFLL